MGYKKAMFSDLSGTIFEETEGAEVRIKTPGKNGEALHYKLDVLPSEIENLIEAGTEVKPRGRKPAETAAK